MIIKVKNLTKVYKTPIKKPGLTGFIKNIFSRQYKTILALNKINLLVENPELIGFIGPNGAGKTTTLKILAGILYPTSGQVSVLGFTPFDKKPSFLKQISFIMGQRNQLIWDLPASDTFRLNKEIYEIEDHLFKKTLDQLSSLLECDHLINKPVKTLSLGERMKMEFIAGLLHQPKLLFLDEPTIGLDLVSQQTIRSFIRKYQKQFKATIIITSHYMEDVKALADRLVIINKGEILYDGSLSKITADYNQEKIIFLNLSKPVSNKIIDRIAKPHLYQFPRLIYRVKKNQLEKKVDQIIKTLPFSDLTIEDERIEDLIKRFF